MQFEPLYQRASTGKLKIWTVEVKGTKDNAQLVISHGEDGGNLITDTREVIGKNIGKSNETTSWDQAVKEAQSRWNKKKDREGYSENKEGNTSSFISPMLAYRFQDRSSDIVYPCYVQPKLNGNRCITENSGRGVDYQSRKGVFWETLSHLDESISKIYSYIKKPLDGEIFHQQLDIQDIGSLIKKFHGADDPIGDWTTMDLEYWIYDYVDPDKNFSYRTLKLMEAFLKAGSTNSGTFPRLFNVVNVYSPVAQSEDHIKSWHKQFITDGFEGTIIRNDVPYVIGHRTKHLQKLKDKMDAEFEIVGGKEGTGREKGTVVFTCKTAEGVEFDVRPKGSIEQRSKWLKGLNKLIGKKLNCDFQEWTKDGKPFHCRGIYIRELD